MNEPKNRITRRTAVATAGAAGALAAVAAALPLAGKAPATQVAAAPKEPEAGEGYRLTDHVKRYYQTTKI